MPAPTHILTDEHKTVRETRDDLVRLSRAIYQLDNSFWLDPASGFSGGTTIVTSGWPHSRHADGSSTGVFWSRYLPSVWVGASAHLDIFVSEQASDAGNFRIQMTARATDDLDGETLSGLSLLTEQVTDAAGAVGVPKRISSSSFILPGRHIQISIVRIGADAADTATTGLDIWGGLIVRE